MSDALRQEMELFLKTTAMPPTRFGRDACGDPHLIRDVRNGREIGTPLGKRLRNFMQEIGR